MKKRTGFTLLEMMIVVVILGILSAVALPMYSNYVKKSRTAEAKVALGDLRVAQRAYYDIRQKYATTLEDLHWKLDGATSGTNVGKSPAYYTYGTGTKGSTARTPHRDVVPEGMDYFGMDHLGNLVIDGASLAE